jgi:hypothetical protein
MNIKEAAKEVLKVSPEPLDSKQIAQSILEQGLWKTNGNTPGQTVAANLYTDIKKNGKASSFRLVSRRKFALNSINSGSETVQLVSEVSLTQNVRTQVFNSLNAL